jgi:hypothetical protein
VIPIQKSKLTRRRACDSTDSTARRENEVRLFFLDWCEISKALLCTGHPPARVRLISGFAAVCVYAYDYAAKARHVCLRVFTIVECIKKVTQRVGWVENPTSPQAV